MKRLVVIFGLVWSFRMFIRDFRLANSELYVALDGMELKIAKDLGVL